MIEFARLPIEEREPFIQEVANRRGLTRLSVEKDFWVCFPGPHPPTHQW